MLLPDPGVLGRDRRMNGESRMSRTANVTVVEDMNCISLSTREARLEVCHEQTA